MTDDEQRPRAERLARNLTRRQRIALRRGRGKPGGIAKACGCRWARTGGAWRHITPCRFHYLHPKPVDDEEMQLIA